MKYRLMLAPLLVAVTFGSGCFGRTSARVSEIEVTRRDGNNTVVTVSEVTYNDDGTVDEMEVTTDGAFDQRYEISYDSGVLERIRVIDDNDDPSEISFDWDGPLLKETSSDNGFYTVNFDYDGDTVDTLEEIERVYQYFDNTSLQTRTTFTRNDENQIVETEEESTFSIPIFGDTLTTTVDEYDWDEGVLERVTRSTTSGNNTDTDVFDFDYNDVGIFGAKTLKDVSNGNTYEVEYDDAGRIAEVKVETGTDESTTTRYTYEDGFSNVIWAPAVPFETSFDMNGTAFANVDIMNISVFLGNFQ